MESTANETKVIYYVDDESIPYRIRIPVDSQTITLADIKSALVRTNCKYFFKSLDADFGYGLLQSVVGIVELCDYARA